MQYFIISLCLFFISSVLSTLSSFLPFSLPYEMLYSYKIKSWDREVWKENQNRVDAFCFLCFVFQNEIKTHGFFSSINWNDLEQKKIPVPFKPNVVNILFHPVFQAFLHLPLLVNFFCYIVWEQNIVWNPMLLIIFHNAYYPES